MTSRIRRPSCPSAVLDGVGLPEPGQAGVPQLDTSRRWGAASALPDTSLPPRRSLGPVQGAGAISLAIDLLEPREARSDEAERTTLLSLYGSFATLQALDVDSTRRALAAGQDAGRCSYSCGPPDRLRQGCGVFAEAPVQSRGAKAKGGHD